MKHRLEIQKPIHCLRRQGAENAGTAEDLTRVRNEPAASPRDVAENERRYRTMVEMSPVGFWQIAPDGRTVFMNQAMRDLLEVDGAEDVTGAPYQGFLMPASLETIERERDKWRHGRRSSCEARIVARRSGASRHVIISGVPLRSAAGEVQGVLATVVDISERRKIEESLRHMARHDALTGLPNRVAFDERLRHDLATAKRLKSIVSILYLDLDNIKDVNDSLGHRAGDLLLQGVAHRLRKCVRDTDCVARLGGDEFAVIAPHLDAAGKVTVLAARIIASLSEPFVLDGREIRTTTSIGITSYPIDATSLDRLLVNADKALYRAKRAGGGTYRFYDPQAAFEASRPRALRHGVP